jgi:hypothetical protein
MLHDKSWLGKVDEGVNIIVGSGADLWICVITFSFSKAIYLNRKLILFTLQNEKNGRAFDDMTPRSLACVYTDFSE